MPDTPSPNRSSRRKFILGIAAGGAVSLLTGCLPRRKDLAPATVPEGVCALTPQSVEGPYFISGALLRQDIREDRAGIPLELRLQVVDIDHGCRPLPQAVVNIWHCDAEGSYSGYTGMDSHATLPSGPPPGPMPGDGTRFLRGIQLSDPQGGVIFRTIYPGWYTGRAVHIHVKIHLNEHELITTQLYFPQELSDRIHSETEPYKKFGPDPTRNATDHIYQADGGALLNIDDAKTGMVATAVLGVKRS
jgi:protocatechuate 3,4-dioxygenase beta subunit